VAQTPPVRSLEQISADFLVLAGRMHALARPHRPLRVDSAARWAITQAIHDLKRHLPGLRSFGHPEGAAVALAECQELLTSGHPGAALVSALYGLSAHPHHPELHYAAAAAALENGAVVEAVLLLRHVLWLKPSHSGAMEDLSAMFASGVLDAALREGGDDGDVHPTPSATDEPLSIEIVEYDDPEDFWAAEDPEAA
jgi:hypothetical protein